MRLYLNFQWVSTLSPCYTKLQLKKWLTLALKEQSFCKAVLTVRVVDQQESAYLNQQYRKKEGPTNVLAFPYSFIENKELQGDIVLCAPIIQKEIQEQGKDTLAHWAHLIIHAALHLQGYDHITDKDSLQMENKEICLLSLLGYPNPYEYFIL